MTLLSQLHGIHQEIIWQDLEGNSALMHIKPMENPKVPKDGRHVNRYEGMFLYWVSIYHWDGQPSMPKGVVIKSI